MHLSNVVCLLVLTIKVKFSRPIPRKVAARRLAAVRNYSSTMLEALHAVHPGPEVQMSGGLEVMVGIRIAHVGERD